MSNFQYNTAFKENINEFDERNIDIKVVFQPSSENMKKI